MKQLELGIKTPLLGIGFMAVLVAIMYLLGSLVLLIFPNQYILSINPVPGGLETIGIGFFILILCLIAGLISFLLGVAATSIINVFIPEKGE